MQLLFFLAFSTSFSMLTSSAGSWRGRFIVLKMFFTLFDAITSFTAFFSLADVGVATTGLGGASAILFSCITPFLYAARRRGFIAENFSRKSRLSFSFSLAFGCKMREEVEDDRLSNMRRGEGTPDASNWWPLLPIFLTFSSLLVESSSSVTGTTELGACATGVDTAFREARCRSSFSLFLSCCSWRAFASSGSFMISLRAIAPTMLRLNFMSTM
mmetsp:Transcript_5002/g.10763  ORF Transcript_5002/g.10763 Transcript_5002/m.10763 type:complete len:215 (-) Transcript_5002:1109-1753(-)